jgi:hypothetical protein
MAQNQAKGNLERISYQKWKADILRQDNESIANKVLEWNPQGGSKKGRPSIILRRIVVVMWWRDGMLVEWWWWWDRMKAVLYLL